jgi:hypothetical protein
MPECELKVRESVADRCMTPSIGEISASCETKGKLGMDALRGCLLVLGDNEMAFSCR